MIVRPTLMRMLFSWAIIYTLCSFAISKYLQDNEIKLDGIVKNITASSTCGYGPNPEEFCLWTRTGRKGLHCTQCDARVPDLSHSINHVLQQSDRWWKSENGRPKVAIDVNLGQEFFVTGIILKMGPTPKPSKGVLERSIDYGKTYSPWEFFESSPLNCITAHNILHNVNLTRSNQVLCKVAKASNIEYDEIVVNLIENRPGWKQFSASEILQNWTKATNIRFRFLDWGTHFGNLMYRDQSVTKTQFYTIKSINIFGRCACYGHDRGCDYDSGTGKMVCKCAHNTCGVQCNICCPGFNQNQWQPSRRCEACNCFGHADDCYYNRKVEEQKLSKNLAGSFSGGGVCINCRDNTTGVNCENCKDGFYRQPQKPATDLDACKECRCDHKGSISNICRRIGGQCQCHNLIGGQACDRCIPGYWGFPSCQPCNCSKTGSFAIMTCNENTGQCLCKQGWIGQHCDQCPLGDKFMMTSYGCLECLNCSLMHYQTLNQLLHTMDGLVTTDWLSKSWIDVRLQWNTESLQNLKSIWQEVYGSDSNANKRNNMEKVKLVVNSMLAQLQIYSEKNIRSFTSLLYRINAIKLVDGSIAARTRHLSRVVKQSYESCHGAVTKLRDLANSRSNPRAVDYFIKEANQKYSSITEINFTQAKQNCYQEQTLAMNLHRKAVMFKGHYLQFGRLRNQLNRLQTRIADIDKRIWDANSNLNRMNSLRRISERLVELKQKMNAIIREKIRLENLLITLTDRNKLSRRFIQVFEDNYLNTPRLNEKLPELKNSLSNYGDFLLNSEKYKPKFEEKLQNLNGNVTEIKSVCDNAIDKPQQIFTNIADTRKIIYLAEINATDANNTLNQVSNILDQFKDKFTEWFPETKFTTTNAPITDLIAERTDEESSGFIVNDDDEDSIDLDKSFLADEVFLEDEANAHPSLSKFSVAESRSNNSNDKLLTGLHTKLQEYVDSVKISEDTVQLSGDVLKSVLSTLEHHSLTVSVPQRLVQENKILLTKASKLLDGVPMSSEMKIKYGRIDLEMRRNADYVDKNVNKALSTLEKLKYSMKPKTLPLPLKSDEFTKLATSLKEKIAQAKAKAGKIRAPLRLTSPGFVKLSLPEMLSPPYSYITTFDIWFNSASGDGFIFLIGNNLETWGTSILLCLSNFHLELHLHQNRHVWKGTHPTSIQNNLWYRFEMEWVCSQLKITLTAARGKSHLQVVQLPWTCDLERVFVPFVWIGGLDNEVKPRFLSISGNGLPDMDGCIGELIINEGTLNLFAWEASRGVQTSCTMSEKDKHHKISGVNLRSDVMQVHSTEDEIFPPLVEFSFRSTQRNATIVHITDVKLEDWMDVKLAKGLVLVEFGHCQKTKLSLPSQLPYNNGQLHHVNINFTGKEILKQVHASVNELDRHSGALFAAQPKPTNIYIGGIPSRSRGQSLLERSPAFVGCLIGLKVNGKTLAISNHSEYLEFSLESCPVRMGTCMCLSTISSAIRVVRLGYIIDFLGLTFQISSLDSSTQGTILYYTPSPKNHLEIFVLEHHVYVAWKVGSKFTKVKLTSVDNGTWHSVLLHNRYIHKNSSVLHVDEASVDLPLDLFLGLKYTAQHIVVLGGKSVGKTQFHNICYKNFLLNDQMKDFSDIAISNGLKNCPSMTI